MRIILIAILIVLIVCLTIFFYTWYRLHKDLNIHVSENVYNTKQYHLPYQFRTFETSDNVKIASWYIPVKNSKAIVILVHGYQTAEGGKPLMLGHAQYLHDAGYTTLLIDMRSVGKSQGNKISLGVNEWKDLVAAYNYVHSLPESKDKKIGFLGISMGAATSIIAAGMSNEGDFVIASVPFASYKNLFSSQIKKEGLPTNLFLPFLRLAGIMELGIHYEEYSPSDLIKNIHVPIFLISAKHDEEVNSNDAKYLFDIANKPKDYWQANSSHDIFAHIPQKFESKVLDFLDNIRNK